jgi:hypothetical protein
MAITLYGSKQNIIQVVQTVKSDVFSTTSTSYTDVTGLSVSITPSSASNRILVVLNSYFSESGLDCTMVRLLRNGTVINVGDAAGSRIQATGASGYDSNSINCIGANFLDSPNTTSSVTYSVQARLSTGTSYLNRTGADGDNALHPRTASTITVMEVAYA